MLTSQCQLWSIQHFFPKKISRKTPFTFSPSFRKESNAPTVFKPVNTRVFLGKVISHFFQPKVLNEFFFWEFLTVLGT